jgi:hypothetical protein
MKLKLACKLFEKYSHFKFSENSFSVGTVIPCGKTEGWTDMKLYTHFRVVRRFKGREANHLHCIHGTRAHTKPGGQFLIPQCIMGVFNIIRLLYTYDQ